MSDLVKIGGILIQGGSGGTSDHKVLTNSTDTVADYLANKVIAGDNIKIETQTTGGNTKLKISSPSDIDDFSTPQLDAVSSSASIPGAQSDKYTAFGHLFMVEAQYEFEVGDKVQLLVTNNPSGTTYNTRVAFFKCVNTGSTRNVQLVAFTSTSSTTWDSKGFVELTIAAKANDGILLPGEKYYALIMLNSTSSDCGTAGISCVNYGLMNTDYPMCVSKTNIGMAYSSDSDFATNYDTLTVESVFAEGSFKPYIRIYHT